MASHTFHTLLAQVLMQTHARTRVHKEGKMETRVCDPPGRHFMLTYMYICISAAILAQAILAQALSSCLPSVAAQVVAASLAQSYWDRKAANQEQGYPAFLLGGEYLHILQW